MQDSYFCCRHVAGLQNYIREWYGTMNMIAVSSCPHLRTLLLRATSSSEAELLCPIRSLLLRSDARPSAGGS